MGLVRATALHSSRATKCPELHNSVALDLSSVLQSDVSTATSARQNYQQKVQTTRREQKGEGEGQRKGGGRERGREKERKGGKGKRGEREPVSQSHWRGTGTKEIRCLRRALKDGQNFSTSNDGNSSNGSSQPQVARMASFA